jgi:hypothetical protein
MKKTRYLFLIIALLLSGITAGVYSQSLESIKVAQKGQSKRATSGNPDNNNDNWKFKPGETREIGRLTGPGEITHIWMTPSSENIRYPSALVLRIYWDGADVPSVETPLGDFFAAGNGMRAEIYSMPVKVSSFGRAYNCYWPMPFKKEARITLTNESRQYNAGCYFMIDWVKYESVPAEGVMYFHARYHQDYNPVYGEFYTVFDVKGNGHYVGTVLSSDNRTGHWYGEGDDIWFIDGEKRPSLYGTGLEDYFNEAWNMRVHSSLYTGCTIYEPRISDARITAYRWHIPDPVIFHKSLKFQLERTGFLVESLGEVITSHGRRPDYWSSVSYWYQDTIAEPWCEFPEYEKRLFPEVFYHLPYIAKSIKHSDGVELRLNPYNRATYLKPWLQVINNTIGSWIEIPFMINEKGKYSISLGQLLRADNGIWKVYIDGKVINEAGESHIPGGYDLETVRAIPVEEVNKTLDFYNIYQKDEHEDYIYGQRHEVKIGMFDFEPGEHAIRLVCVGSNPLTANPENGNRRYNLTADVLSLRKFPEEGLEEWMERAVKDSARQKE